VINLSKKLIIILTSLTLLGCGFELQNTVNFAGKFETLYIQTADPYTVFYRTIRRQMLSHGVEIVTESVNVDYALIIHQDESNQRTLSVSGRNTPREYEVYYLVKWSLVKGNQVIIQPMTSSKYQDYTFDQRQLLGKSNESRIIQEALAEDIVQMILVKLNQVL
tara:strand:- start:283 stop:774 length:492 start_codon:yes stop_codon:yes gene_type:complete